MRSVRRLLVGALFVFVSTSVLAQDSEPEHINVRVVTVKADRISQWEGLIDERSVFRREEGQRFYHVYQRLRGPLHTYLIVTPANDIRPQPAGVSPAPRDLQNWVTALNSTIESESVTTLVTYPEAKTIETESPAPPTGFVHVRIRTAAAGRVADFEEWLREELVPGLREAGAGDIRSGRVVLGGSPRTWVTFSFVPGWPEPVVELDPRILARGDELIATQTDYFYRFREDLSFTAD